jgi:hypothetical protein
MLLERNKLFFFKYPITIHKLFLEILTMTGELILLGFSLINLVVYKNMSLNGVISFEKKVDWSFGFDNPSDISLNDLDGDGKPDLALANYGDDFGGGGRALIYKNISTTDTIDFEYITEIGGGYATNLSVGDLDGDNKPDIAVRDGNYFGGSRPLTVLKNTSFNRNNFI